MPALDFPANPTNGQLYDAYVYDSSIGSWRSQGSTNNLATQVAALQANDAYDYHPNVIINGAFDIWQRGTSFNGFSAGTSVFGPDRFYAYRTSLSTGMTITRQLSGLTGIQYCARVQRDSGNTATTNTNFLYDIETINSIPMAGKTVTLSFYARAGANFSSANNIMFTEFVMGTGTDQALRSGYTGGTSVSTNHTLTTSWQRFNVVVTVPSNVTQIGLVFKNTPVGTAGAADYYEITGVQLEEGSSATPFRRNANSIQGELAACQRYYFRDSAVTSSQVYGNGNGTGGTSPEFQIRVPVTMRIQPTSMEAVNIRCGVPAVVSYTLNSLVINTGKSGRDVIALVGGTSTNTTAREYLWLEAFGTTNSYIAFSAEL